MLTPAFELSQDDSYLTIIIKAPFAKITDSEIFIEENDFKFYSKPYFLRLTLPGNIVEDGREKAEYNAGEGVFTVTVPKETAGEYFEGLDMITKLLVPKGASTAAKPLIEVLGDHPDADVDGEGEEEEVDWSLPQTPYQPPVVLPGAPTYGFANQKSGVFQTLRDELCGVIDCPEPDSLTVTERREKRLAAEVSKFDEDHYLGDLHEDDLIQTILSYTPSWYHEYEMLSSGTPVDVAVELTEEEKDVMRKLPKKEYLLDKAADILVYLGLVDIIYAFAYNKRTTEGENSVESGWTISKLSATLSWLESNPTRPNKRLPTPDPCFTDPDAGISRVISQKQAIFESVEEVMKSCYRRSLCYPLYRHWQVNQAVQADVQCIFNLGRRGLLKSLLEIRQLLMDTESRYVLNDLYITDYCVWIQTASEKKLQSVAETLSKVKLSKEDVGFDLVEAERVAQIALEAEESEFETVTQKMSQISVKTTAEDSDDSDSDESDTTESDVTSSSEEVESDEDNNHEENVTKILEKDDNTKLGTNKDDGVVKELT